MFIAHHIGEKLRMGMKYTKLSLEVRKVVMVYTRRAPFQFGPHHFATDIVPSLRERNPHIEFQVVNHRGVDETKLVLEFDTGDRITCAIRGLGPEAIYMKLLRVIATRN